MSDWDEKAEAWAYDSRAYRQGIKSLVVDTARWQRAALLSEESVKRGAKALFLSRETDAYKLGRYEYSIQDWDNARTALVAAIEGGE